MAEPERTEVRIERAGRERLDDLQPLWEVLHRHPVDVAPPEYRGRRVGSELMRAFFRQLREMGIEDWSVASITSNSAARRFYQRFEVLPSRSPSSGKVPPAEL